MEIALDQTTSPKDKASIVGFKTFLLEVSQFPDLHARFLNTLSFLEYIGARKILKSQRAETISLEVLSHTAEEIRHSQILKKVALKMSEQKLASFSDSELLCGPEACRYFQTLDQAAARALGDADPWTNYLLTTLMIEERANSIYPFYEGILSKCGFPGILKAIVREEDAHLQDISAQIQHKQELSENLLNQLRELEDHHFLIFLSALRKMLPTN